MLLPNKVRLILEVLRKFDFFFTGSWILQPLLDCPHPDCSRYCLAVANTWTIKSLCSFAAYWTDTIKQLPRLHSWETAVKHQATIWNIYDGYLLVADKWTCWSRRFKTKRILHMNHISSKYQFGKIPESAVKLYIWYSKDTMTWLFADK